MNLDIKDCELYQLEQGTRKLYHINMYAYVSDNCLDFEDYICGNYSKAKKYYHALQEMMPNWYFKLVRDAINNYEVVKIADLAIEIYLELSEYIVDTNTAVEHNNCKYAKYDKTQETLLYYCTYKARSDETCFNDFIYSDFLNKKF